MQLIVDQEPPSSKRVEVVERKGLGHPDTLCDAVAERICARLCQHYLRTFGVILHHNVDKVLLCGGASAPAFGGGTILEPMELYLAGRVTSTWQGVAIPVDEIAIAACREVFRETLPELDVDRDVRVIPRFRPGSRDLTSLFAREHGVPANDTSCGAGFAPLTDLERVVLAVERGLTAASKHPEIGADVKVMGVRVDERIMLTVGCAFRGRYVVDLRDYAEKKKRVRDRVLATAREITKCEVDATINAADDVERGDVYLTVSGTSAEAGDDGEVGRGNRVSGLITPCRWMSMEAAAGKNPVSHVGKIYSVLAHRIAGALVTTQPSASDAACLLVSQIGRDVGDPALVHLRLSTNDRDRIDERAVEDIVRRELEGILALRGAILEGKVTLF